MAKKKMTAERLREVLSPYPDVQEYVIRLIRSNNYFRDKITELDAQIEAIKPSPKRTGTVKDNPTEGRPKALTEEEKENIRYLRTKNHSLRSLARVYGVSHETIRKALKEGSERSENVQEPIDDLSLLEDYYPDDHQPFAKQLHPKKDKKSSEYDFETLISADPHKVDKPY